MCVCAFETPGLDPSYIFLFHEDKIIEWTDFLQSFYTKGHTIQNKANHIANLLSWIMLNKPRYVIDEVRGKKCLALLREVAQAGKVKGNRQRTKHQNSIQRVAKGKPGDILQYLCFI
jgi:DNA-directed RNA polymerase beta' subunit